VSHSKHGYPRELLVSLTYRIDDGGSKEQAARVSLRNALRGTI
jgi:hypothetical protein